MAEKGKEMSATVKHDDWLLEQLKDGDFAAEYLNAASEDDDPKTYLTALAMRLRSAQIPATNLARGGLPVFAGKGGLRSAIRDASSQRALLDAIDEAEL